MTDFLSETVDCTVCKNGSLYGRIDLCSKHIARQKEE